MLTLIKESSGLVVTLLIFFVISLGHGAAFMWFLPTLAFFFYIIYKTSIKKVSINTTLFQVSVFLILFCALTIKHSYSHNKNREYANTLANEIIQFKQSNSHYPKSWEELGIDVNDPKFKYMYSDKYGPILAYSKEFSAFQSYYYDFDSNNWGSMGG